MIRSIFVVLLIVTAGCAMMTKRFGGVFTDFRSETLTSSRGEKIYINKVNWGVAGDDQLTTISNDPLKLKESRDTTNTVYGLDPFDYEFKNDTLTLYFPGEVTYTVKEKFSTIALKYVPETPLRP